MRGMSLAHTSRVDGEGEDIKFKSFAPVENFAWRKNMVRVLMEVDVEVAELIIFSAFIELGGNET